MRAARAQWAEGRAAIDLYEVKASTNGNGDARITSYTPRTSRSRYFTVPIVALALIRRQLEGSFTTGSVK
jgi:hypothetical protein